MWTEFYDMCSGGQQKEKYDKIFIQAPLNEAIVIFYNKFGHNPDRVSCTCCGADYYVSQVDTVVNDTGKNILIIPASDIKDEERIGDVPEEGYVWK